MRLGQRERNGNLKIIIFFTLCLFLPLSVCVCRTPNIETNKSLYVYVVIGFVENKHKFSSNKCNMRKR